MGKLCQPSLVSCSFDWRRWWQSVFLLVEHSFRLFSSSIAVPQRWARDVMNLIELEPGLPMKSVFTSTQVYSGSKVRHFGAIRKDTGIPYEDMIFFDDWDQNCVDVGGLGVTCIECPRVRGRSCPLSQTASAPR